jgi:hypothetical protein
METRGTDPYEVTKKLPESRGEFEYRIKSINEPHAYQKMQ